jgi:DNA invertase Pin-like site-specific DNA recombinase
VTLEDLDIETHLVKENQTISKDAKSQARFIHGINLVVARNYSENLREEVKKGMLEKARQGIYPGHAHSATATIRRSERSTSIRSIRQWSFA